MFNVKIISYNFSKYIINNVKIFKYDRIVEDFVNVNIVVVFILSLMSFSFI